MHLTCAYYVSQHYEEVFLGAVQKLIFHNDISPAALPAFIEFLLHTLV